MRRMLSAQGYLLLGVLGLGVYTLMHQNLVLGAMFIAGSLISLGWIGLHDPAAEDYPESIERYMLGFIVLTAAIGLVVLVYGVVMFFGFKLPPAERSGIGDGVFLIFAAAYIGWLCWYMARKIRSGTIRRRIESMQHK